MTERMMNEGVLHTCEVWNPRIFIGAVLLNTLHYARSNYMFIAFDYALTCIQLFCGGINTQHSIFSYNIMNWSLQQVILNSPACLNLHCKAEFVL